MPVFLDSKATRLIQLADLLAFSIFRFFEHGDGQYFDLIKHRFDEEGGIQHGFHVLHATAVQAINVQIEESTTVVLAGTIRQ